MRVRVLGAVGIEPESGAPILGVGGSPNQRLLGQLAMSYPHPVRRGTLVEIAWGPSPPSSPGPALRMAISRLRALLTDRPGQNPIPHLRGSYVLSPGLLLDATQLGDAVRAATNGASDTTAIQELTEALGSWRGIPYDGLDVPAFEAEREHLSRLRIDAISHRQHALLRERRGGEGVSDLTMALAEHPLHEGMAALLMETLYVAGDQPGALRVFEEIRLQLREELGLDASPHMNEVHLAVLRHNLTHREPRLEHALATSLFDQPEVPYGAGWIVGPIVMPDGADRLGATTATDQLGLLAARAQTAALTGQWTDAARGYIRAIGLASADDNTDLAAELAMQLARITWDRDLGIELSALLTKALVATEDEVLRARLGVCLSSGPFRTGAEGGAISGPNSVLDRLATVVAAGEPLDIAWATMQARDAITGVVPPEQTLELTDRVTALRCRDTVVDGQNERARFADLLRLDQQAEALRTLRNLPGAEGPSQPTVNAFGRITAQNCWDLALGRFESVRVGLAHAMEFSGRLSAATLDQVVLGQSYWLTRELGEDAAVTAHIEGAVALDATDGTTPLWRVAAALLATDANRPEQAAELLAEAHARHDLTALPPGSHNAGLLSMISETLASVSAGGGESELTALAAEIYTQLAATPMPAVLLGWPTVFFGSKERFLGFAAQAAGQPEHAARHLIAAVHADRHHAPLRARSMFALAHVSPAHQHLKAEATRIRTALRARVSGPVSARRP